MVNNCLSPVRRCNQSGYVPSQPNPGGSLDIGANAVTDILSGQIHMNIGTTATIVPLVNAGRLRAIAVIGEGRYADLPDVPTMDESGVPLTFTFWTGLLAPAATPPDVLRTLNETGNELLDVQISRPSLEDVFIELTGSSLRD